MPTHSLINAFATSHHALSARGVLFGQQIDFTRHLPSIWNDPILATGVATAAVSLLVVTAWLLRRRSRQGRGAAIVCLIVSVALHLVLIFFLPHLRKLGGGISNRDASDDTAGDSEMVFASFDPDADSAGAASESGESTATLQPLPLSDLLSKQPSDSPATEIATDQPQPASEAEQPDTAVADSIMPTSMPLPDSIATQADEVAMPATDNFLADWLSDAADTPIDKPVDTAVAEAAPPQSPTTTAAQNAAASPSVSASISDAAAANVPGLVVDDFANRSGQSKRIALLQTGGDESTEAAVEAALRFLAADQRPDGSWDPVTSGAGRETRTLGTDRKSAGKNATTGLTGLALLSMLGAGNTHQKGTYADNVRRGLTYLILNQKPDGSLAGNAETYEANYCHGMAALAMCEAAAMTRDPAAIASAASAVRFTTNMQHPTTGGWRYVAGDPGDLSQLGWQAMVLEAGRAAGVPINQQSFTLTSRFVRSVRGGSAGGLASYRPGDGPSRTMTAEALATRLLLGESVPAVEIREAEDYMLRQPPGIGRDNYYYWYYASIALHQLQDDAWRSWNAAMKSHLLARQSSGGSWPTDSEWGGYGGRVYTTAMAALCLEVYYRHVRRDAAVPMQTTLPGDLRR